MFDLEDVIDPTLLSSTSPSSDLMDMPLLVAMADEESIETLFGLWPPFPAETEFEPEPAMFRQIFLGSIFEQLSCTRKSRALVPEKQRFRSD